LGIVVDGCERLGPRAMTADTRRVNRGAGHSWYLDGEPVDGVTTILSNGVPKPAMIDAAARETANYAVNNWDALANEGLAQRLRKIEKGRFEGWNRATVRGTRVHEYAAALLGGHEIDVPEPYVAHVDACLAFLDRWRIREVEVEVSVVNRAHRYMGAADLLAYVGDNAPLCLIDWKTGASGIWPETALQLAAYAHAETILDGDGGERPLPTVDAAFAVWLRADGYDVFPVDISDATFRTFLYVQQVAQFRAAPREAYVGDALAAPFEAVAS
jgi:hypothetical protein